MNIADIITEHAQGRPDHPAIEDGDKVVSYSELNALVNAAAANLHDAGIKSGDIVAIILPDSADHIVVLYALARLGAVVLPIDGRLPRHERRMAVEGFDIKAVVAEPVQMPVSTIATLDVNDVCRRAVKSATASIELDVPVLFDENRPLMVVQSSGTTGTPKRFLWTHAHFRSRGLVQVRHLGLTPSDRYLQVPNLTFMAGRRRCIMMQCLGATVVINRAPSSEPFLAYLTAKRITFTCLTPAHLRPLLASVDGARPKTTAKIVVTSSPVAREERILARRRLTPNLFECYATNEVGDLAFATPADQDAYPDAVGRVVENVEAQIVDADDKPLPAGEVGLVRFRGPEFPTRYLEDPEATARAFRDGWFYPGDLAQLNEEGYLFFKGRADDVINNEGAKFYPVEVEATLLAHPQVIEAAVLGWPHKRHGEVAVAFVVTASAVAQEDVVAFCRKRIAGYKVPGIIEGDVPVDVEKLR